MKPPCSTVLVLLLALHTAPLGGEPFHPAKSPVIPAPPERWNDGLLRPAAILGDTTHFNVNNLEPEQEPFYHDVALATDSGNTYLFAATGRGLETFDATNPQTPFRLSFAYGVDKLLEWGHSDTNFFLNFVDTHPGNPNLVAMGGTGQGFVLWDTTVKTNPRVIYQDRGAHANSVWLYADLSHLFAVAVADSNPGGGIKLYDASFATLLPGCLDNSNDPTSLCFVYQTTLGARPVTRLSGVEGHTLDALAALSQVATVSHVEIWDVDTAIIFPPLAPLLDAPLPGTPARDIALWERNGAYFLAALRSAELDIYDVSCIASGSLPCTITAPIATISVPGQPQIDQVNLSVGQIQGRPLLYVGNLSDGPSACLPQREYVLDVSDATRPRDITPAPVPPGGVDGPLVGYWGWYYAPCSTGFNNVRPMRAAFDNERGALYRAGFSLLDAHEIHLVVFEDGFESGNPEAWSDVVGD